MYSFVIIRLFLMKPIFQSKGRKMKLKLLITGLAATVAVVACSSKDKALKPLVSPSSSATTNSVQDKSVEAMNPTEQVQGLDAMTMSWDDGDAKKAYQERLKGLNVRILVNDDIQSVLKQEASEKHSKCTILAVGTHLAAGDQLFIKSMVGEKVFDSSEGSHIGDASVLKQNEGKLKVEFTLAKIGKDGTPTSDKSVNNELTLRCINDFSVMTFGDVSAALNNKLLFFSAN